jgi:hypothetical protein
MDGEDDSRTGDGDDDDDHHHPHHHDADHDIVQQCGLLLRPTWRDIFQG